MEVDKTETTQTQVTVDLKQNLEIEKLQNEIIFQKNPLKNPANWAPFATMIGTSFALIWAISSGWFTNQNDKLNNQNTLLAIQKIELNKEIENFKAQKLNLIEQNRNLQDSINSQLQTYKTEVSKKYEIVKRLNQNISNNYFELLSNLNNEMARIISISTSDTQIEQMKNWNNAINGKDGKNRKLLENISSEIKQINALLKK